MRAKGLPYHKWVIVLLSDRYTICIAGLKLDARIVRHGELRSLFAKNTSATFATLANVFHNSRTNLRNLKNSQKTTEADAFVVVVLTACQRFSLTQLSVLK